MGAFDPYVAADRRYEGVPYRRVGESGLKLPAVSLGLWHNFGDDKPLQTQRDILRRAFDLGVNHFDLANNYGPPPGSAERNFGTLLAEDFRPYRDELIISSKAGWDMWPGPYGFGGSRKYLLASLDQSLQRMGLDYVDVFYSHRPDPETPLEEIMGALHHAVTSGRALYVGISSYGASLTARAQEIMRDLGTPLLIHQPSYSMLNRWVERGEETPQGTASRSLLETTAAEGMGVIAFSPLAQGLLTNRYLGGVPEDSRAAAGKSLSGGMLSEENLARVRGLAELAAARGQTLAQMAIAWVLRAPAVTSALIGASSVAQLEDSVGAVANLDFSDAELAAIDEFAVDGGVNIWWGATESTP
ncbi:L-glyceraldehyde 3-phosphate reductase [Tsukamurella pseudospumae]|uniref:Aldo/keto reductase n=1 Tax=Tsukamurella pseudospumae TaxID=239498 RepID=A0A138A1E2_9ACTN|nr:L-glyceraldehyde 3-phosphate reductase [Tsukamurella pseudospumae]KXP04242.1 aldo/keto reductase [Tsukamurella pseudospumae]